MYLFHEMHTNTEHIAVPHPPQESELGHLPPRGKVLCGTHPIKFQLIE